MLNKKNQEAGNTKLRKRDLKEKGRQKTPQNRRIDERQILTFNILMLFFHETKANNKRKKQKQGSKIKQNTKRRTEGK